MNRITCQMVTIKKCHATSGSFKRNFYYYLRNFSLKKIPISRIVKCDLMFDKTLIYRNYFVFCVLYRVTKPSFSFNEKLFTFTSSWIIILLYIYCSFYVLTFSLFFFSFSYVNRSTLST